MALFKTVATSIDAGKNQTYCDIRFRKRAFKRGMNKPRLSPQ
jgi:hypothetical protein